MVDTGWWWDISRFPAISVTWCDVFKLLIEYSSKSKCATDFQQNMWYHLNVCLKFEQNDGIYIFLIQYSEIYSVTYSIHLYTHLDMRFPCIEYSSKFTTDYLSINLPFALVYPACCYDQPQLSTFVDCYVMNSDTSPSGFSIHAQLLQWKFTINIYKYQFWLLLAILVVEAWVYFHV